MSLFKIFHSAGAANEQHNELVQCLEGIICTVFEKSGVQKCIRFPSDDTAVAFAGNIEEPELYLTLEWQKYNKQKYLYASLDNEYSWGEWDFADRNDFCQNLAEHISQRVNSKIKTVTEKTKHESIRITVYKMDKSGEWQLISEDYSDHKLIRPFVTENRIEETIKDYHI